MYTVYAARDADGVCLYVGITRRRLAQRVAEHERDSDWARLPGVVFGVCRTGLTKTEAMRVERDLIHAWCPLHNTQHSLLPQLGRNARLAWADRKRPARIDQDWIAAEWVRACRLAGLEARIDDRTRTRPMLGALHSRSTKDVWIFHLSPAGIPLHEVRDKADEIAAWLHAELVEIRIHSKTEGLAIIGFGNVWPDTIPFRAVAAGADAIPFARTAIPGEYVDLPVQPGPGEGHAVIIAGQSGSGKSRTVETVLTQLVLRGGVELWLADPKQVDLAPFHPVARYLATEDHQITALLTEAVAEMERRYTWLRDHGYRNTKEAAAHPDCPGPLWVVLEELNDITVDVGPRKREQAMIRKLSKKCRAAGIMLVLIIQSPYVIALPGDVADNVPRYIVHSTKRMEQTRAATAGDEGAAPAHELIMGQHLAYTQDPKTGQRRLIKSMLVPDGLVEEVVAAHTAHTQPDEPKGAESGDTRPTVPPCSPIGNGEGRSGLDSSALAGLPVRSAGVPGGGGVVALDGFRDRIDREHPLATPGKGKVTAAKQALWEAGVREAGQCPGGCGRTISWRPEEGESQRIGFRRGDQVLHACPSCQGRLSRGTRR